MVKYIFWSIVLFVAYRFWYAPKQLDAGNNPPPQEPDNGEYAEYEEIKD